MKKLFRPFLVLTLASVALVSCDKEEDPDDTDDTVCNEAAHDGYTTIATDVCGDGANAALLDGTRLEYMYDATSDSLWFLATVNEVSSSQAIGLNVMLNIPNGGSTFNFWGDDNQNAFHKLITVWVTGTAPSSYSGTIGVADADGVANANFTNLSADNISVVVNTEDKTILIGMKRTDAISSTEFSSGSITVGVAGAVGSNESWNDDIYSASGSMTLDM